MLRGHNPLGIVVECVRSATKKYIHSWGVRYIIESVSRLKEKEKEKDSILERK